MDKFSRVNGNPSCGWPMLPSRLDGPDVDDLDLSGTCPTDWTGQVLVPGEDVVLARGNVFDYSGVVNTRLNRRLKDYCRDFSGCYVLARVPKGLNPQVQIHDVISNAQQMYRMDWLTKMLSSRGVRESNYVIAPCFPIERPINLRLKLMEWPRNSEILIKDKNLRCYATLKSTVKTDGWIKVKTADEANIFFNKMRAGG